MGDRSRALSDAEKVIEMNRTWYKGYSRKASVLLHVRKYKDCIEMCKIGRIWKWKLRLALSLEPDNEAVLHILSLADKASTAQVLFLLSVTWIEEYGFLSVRRSRGNDR